MDTSIASSELQVHLQNMMQEFSIRRELIVDGLRSLKGIECSLPGGSFFVFPNVEKTGMNGEEFAKKWNWFGVMHNLCNGEIVNLERITNLSLYECLTWLTYETDLNETKAVKI